MAKVVLFFLPPRSVFVSDNYAYIASFSSNALEIVDISNPTLPVHAGKILHSTGGAVLVNPRGVYVSGNYAYVASYGSNALEIIHVVTSSPLDTTPPVITLLGTTPITIEKNSVYTDAGATALDDIDGDLTSSIVTVNPVDTSTVGTYTVTYNVSDASLNPAVQVTRTVNVQITPVGGPACPSGYTFKNGICVISDTTPPVITRLGSSPVTIEKNSIYTDAGATATDNIDGDLTISIVTVNGVKTNKVGTYTVTYNVKDAANNSATEVTRTVNVVKPDTTTPVITLIGSNPININRGDTYADQGATATDNKDGDLTKNIVTLNMVNASTVGTYTVTYNVKDAANNLATEVTRTVNVKTNPTPPPTKSPCELNPNDPACIKPSNKEIKEILSDIKIVTTHISTEVTPTEVLNSTATEVKDSLTNYKDLAKIVITKAKKEIEKKEVDITIKTIAVVGILTGATLNVLPTLFASPLSAGELVLIPLRLWTLLLTALGIRKKGKPWGTVYDSVTKQPLDPAYVILKNDKGEEVASSITDIDGRYGFFVEPGTYTIEVGKTDYKFPSDNLKGKSSDELYIDIYQGETITITGEAEVITKNIPMDPVKFNWNEFAKKQNNLMRFYSKKDFILNNISNTLFTLGAIVAVIALILAPGPYNIITFAIYVILFIIKQLGIKQKDKGTIIQKENNLPLSFSILHILAKDSDTEIAHKVTDKRGRFYCLISNGTYRLKIDKKLLDGSYESILLPETVSISQGILKGVVQI